MRIGQIAGGPNGSWATTDWVPIIVKSSIALGSLPNSIGVCHVISLYAREDPYRRLGGVVDARRRRCGCCIGCRVCRFGTSVAQHREPATRLLVGRRVHHPKRDPRSEIVAHRPFDNRTVRRMAGPPREEGIQCVV